MTTALATQPNAAEMMERVVIGGDLSKLSSTERLNYYRSVCASVGLNPLTKPFEYLTLNGRLILYARKDATDQLRQIHQISLTIAAREQVGDVYAVTARAANPAGRTDESIGAVATSGLKGDALANALMKAETKAKRRVTLSICGLGMLDETELETIPAQAKAIVPRIEATSAAIPDAAPAAEPVALRPVDEAVAAFDGHTSLDESRAFFVRLYPTMADWNREDVARVIEAKDRAKARLGEIRVTVTP